MAARFACCGGYTAMVDAQIEQLSLARLRQMLLLCGWLWVLTPFGLQRATLPNIAGNCRVSRTTLHGLLAKGVGILMCTPTQGAGRYARSMKHRVLRTHAMTMTVFLTCFIAMRGLQKG